MLTLGPEDSQIVDVLKNYQMCDSHVMPPASLTTIMKCSKGEERNYSIVMDRLQRSCLTSGIGFISNQGLASSVKSLVCESKKLQDAWQYISDALPSVHASLFTVNSRAGASEVCE